MFFVGFGRGGRGGGGVAYIFFLRFGTSFGIGRGVWWTSFAPQIHNSVMIFLYQKHILINPNHGSTMGFIFGGK